MGEKRFRLNGDADMLAAPGIAEDLRTVIDACGEDVLIDCAGLTFIDSSGIGVLIDTRNALDAQGRRLRIVNMPRIGRRAIEVLGLTDFLGVDESAECEPLTPQRQCPPGNRSAETSR